MIEVINVRQRALNSIPITLPVHRQDQCTQYVILVSSCKFSSHNESRPGESAR